MERKHLKNRRGFTLLDSLLTLFVVGSMILIYGGLVNSRELNRRVLFRAQAAALVDEEVNALRRLGFDNLSNVSGVDFKNVLHNAGGWDITGGGVTGNTLELSGHSSIATTSGRLLFPAGVYATGTLEAKWKVAADSPSGWAVGYLLQASDKDNGYRLLLSATGTDISSQVGAHNLVFSKLVNGTPTELFVKAVTFNADTWYTLRVVLSAAAPTIKIYLNENQQDTNNITDQTYASGGAALVGWHGAHAYVDEISDTGVWSDCSLHPANCWDFDDDTEWPAAWTRFGLNDLPDGTPNVLDDNGNLTIADYGTSVDELKEVTVEVEWQQSGQTLDYTSTVLIGNSNFGQ